MGYLNIFFILLIPVICGAQCVTTFSETYLTMLMNEKRSIEFIISNCTHLQNVSFELSLVHEENLEVRPKVIILEENINVTTTYMVEIEALRAGETTLYTTPSTPEVKQAFVTAQVYKNELIEIFSVIIGWAYFFCWSVSFYPQIYDNWKRKSVIGLNFDFVIVNITGYVLYSMFNLGLCYIPAIKLQYEERYPFSIVSVMPNDIVFGVHALALTIYTGLQCFWYERGDQSVSWFGKWFHYISALVLLFTGIACFVGYMLWLDFLYICSYIKLSVTFCKYGPQAIMNYKRQSTAGWSIETVLLDIAGGVFSVLQMFMNAYNYDKWAWILENPTKLWLGIFSLLFDFFFVFQHYCLYSEKGQRRRQGKADAKAELALSENNCVKLTEQDLSNKEKYIDC